LPSTGEATTSTAYAAGLAGLALLFISGGYALCRRSRS
jgi:LPXTG-motif cell wall-anchored protein